jgi:dCMP deaminase
MEPRKDRLEWNDHHMMMALLTSQRSPDPNTQVGACIVDDKHRILGTGYNSFPRGICSSAFSWDRENPDPLKNKYAYVVHAEKNAISNTLVSIRNTTLFVTLFPCNECMKDIIQAGIRKVIYLDDKYKDQWTVKAAKQMADLVDLEHQQYIPSKHIALALTSISNKLLV